MIRIEKRNNIDIVTFGTNKINALVSDDIKNSINTLFENANSKVIIDLKGVEYIDSSGFGCFLTIMKTARNNYGILKFSNPEPRVMELFEILHLHTVFQIYNNLDSCIETFN